MATKNKLRTDFVRNETDVFTDLGYDVTVESSQMVTLNPTSAINTTGSIDFAITGNDKQYIDWTRTRLELILQVVGEHGGLIAAQNDKNVLNYAVANYILNSLFESLKVFVNEVEVSSKNSLYGYQAILETLLSYGSDYKKGQAEAGGFYRVKNELVQDDDGWKSRRALCNESRLFEVAGRPHNELFNQMRYMLPGNDVRLQFYKAADSFALECHGTGKEKLKIKVIDAKLKVRKLHLLPSIHLSHLKLWQDHPVIYPGIRVSMKSYSIATGSLEHTNESILRGLIPNRLIMGLVGTENAQGHYERNPYAFEDHDIKEIVVNVQDEHPTQHVIKVDKANDRVLSGFLSVYDAMGATNCEPGLDLRKEEYKNGKFLFGFDLRDLGADGQPIPRHGTVSIQLNFKRATTASLTAILYPEYPYSMYITNDKSVYFKDYVTE